MQLWPLASYSPCLKSEGEHGSMKGAALIWAVFPRVVATLLGFRTGHLCVLGQQVRCIETSTR